MAAVQGTNRHLGTQDRPRQTDKKKGLAGGEILSLRPYYAFMMCNQKQELKTHEARRMRQSNEREACFCHTFHARTALQDRSVHLNPTH
jgi:hypothetical protein